MNRLPGLVVLISFLISFQMYAQRLDGSVSSAIPESDSSAALDESTTIKMKYAVLDARGDWVPCQESSPEIRERETATELQTFPEIQKDPLMLQAILGRLNLANSGKLEDDEQLLVFCEYKKLRSIDLEPWGEKYRVINSSHDGSSTADDGAPQGWTSVDRNGYIQSMFVERSAHAVSDRLSDQRAEPPIGDAKAEPPTPERKTPIPNIDLPELRYRIVDRFADIRPCGPRIERVGQAIDAFPHIQRDSDTFTRIVKHVGLSGQSNFTDEQKRLILKEHEKLTAVTLVLLVRKYQFSFGSYIGLIDLEGQIRVLKTIRGGSCPK